MPSAHHVLSFVWAGLGVIIAFFAWAYIQPMLGNLPSIGTR